METANPGAQYKRPRVIEKGKSAQSAGGSTTTTPKTKKHKKNEEKSKGGASSHVMFTRKKFRNPKPFRGKISKTTLRILQATQPYIELTMCACVF
jgi:hypothetical protein